MPPNTPHWREHQSQAGHEDHAARFVIVTRGDYDLEEGLREALNSAHDELNLEAPDEEEVSRFVAIEWSDRLAVSDPVEGGNAVLARTIYRVTLRPDDSGWEDVGRDATEVERPQGTPSRGDSLVFAFADALTALPLGDDTTPGIDHILKLHDPQRLAHCVDLYREIAAIEMAVRECLSLIFLRAYPDRPHAYLDRTKIKACSTDDEIRSNDADRRRTYLAVRQENELFHILFSDYPLLNEPPDVNLAGLVQKIRSATSFDDFKDLLRAFPITSDDSEFIAALRVLLDPVERVRNPIAHNRAIPQRAWDNYENARTKIWERIAQFWADQEPET